MKDINYRMFEDLKTPQELLSFMGDIKYGWMKFNGEKVFGKEDSGWINENGDELSESTSLWLDQKIMSAKEVIENNLGICVDQVELEREFFDKNHFEFEVYDIAFQKEDSRPGHAFVIYKEGENWNYFEHSWGENKGIYKFDDKKSCLSYVAISFAKNIGVDNDQLKSLELIETRHSFSGLSQKERLKVVLEGENIINEIQYG